MEDASGDAHDEDDHEDDEAEAEAGPSQAAERVTITINGEEVDITDTGIDITFLEALPDVSQSNALSILYLLPELILHHSTLEPGYAPGDCRAALPRATTSCRPTGRVGAD